MGHKVVEIRWRDMDNFGHVNNSCYLTYLEEARDESPRPSQTVTCSRRVVSAPMTIATTGTPYR